MSQIKLAEQQLTGFAHASKGFTINDLASSMGLTKREWMKLRDVVDLKPLDRADLDEKYGIKQALLHPRAMGKPLTNIEKNLRIVAYNEAIDALEMWKSDQNENQVKQADQVIKEMNTYRMRWQN